MRISQLARVRGVDHQINAAVFKAAKAYWGGRQGEMRAFDVRPGDLESVIRSWCENEREKNNKQGLGRR